MRELGKIYLDDEGYVVISWEDGLGKEVTENGLQEKASDICDLIATEILNIVWE